MPDGVFNKTNDDIKCVLGEQANKRTLKRVKLVFWKYMSVASKGSNCVLGLKRVKLPKIAKNTLKTASLRELTNIFSYIWYCSGKKSVMLDVQS